MHCIYEVGLITVQCKTLGLTQPLFPGAGKQDIIPGCSLSWPSLPMFSEGLSMFVRVRIDFLCLSPVLFAKEKCPKEYSLLVRWVHGMNWPGTMVWIQPIFIEHPRAKFVGVLNTPWPQHLCPIKSVILLVKWMHATAIVSKPHYQFSLFPWL